MVEKELDKMPIFRVLYVRQEFLRTLGKCLHCQVPKERLSAHAMLSAKKQFFVV
jgi:hypothetical protein